MKAINNNLLAKVRNPEEVKHLKRITEAGDALQDLIENSEKLLLEAFTLANKVNPSNPKTSVHNEVGYNFREIARVLKVKEHTARAIFGFPPFKSKVLNNRFRLSIKKFDVTGQNLIDIVDFTPHKSPIILLDQIREYARLMLVTTLMYAEIGEIMNEHVNNPWLKVDFQKASETIALHLNMKRSHKD